MQTPPLFFITVRFLVVESCKYPCSPHGARQECWLLRRWGSWISPLGFLFSLEESYTQKRPLYVVLHQPGGGHCSASPPCSRIPSVVFRSWILFSCSSCEGEWSEEWPMLPSWWPKIRLYDFYHSSNVVFHIYWFVYVEPSLHSKNKSYLVIVYNPVSILLNLVCW